MADLNIQKLSKAYEESWRKLEVYRKKRIQSIQQFVGTHYSDDGAAKSVPINLIELAVTTYTQRLIARNPRFLVTTKFPSLRPPAHNLQLALDHLTGELDLDKRLQSCVVDAMFGLGIMKVGMARGNFAEVDGEEIDIGQPYAEPISLDDWVIDMTAKTQVEAEYEGHRFTMPIDEAREIYDEPSLEPITDTNYNFTGDQRERYIGAGQEDQEDRYTDMGEFLELFHRPTNSINVFELNSEGKLRRQLWKSERYGPEQGQYIWLNFHRVPGNIMPLSPVATMRDLHDVVNLMYRKMEQQAERQKTIGIVRPGGEDDGRRIVEANDGEMIKSDDPKNVGEIRFGGVDQTNFAFMKDGINMFSWTQGNLDAIGGLGPQAGTLGQEEIIESNSSKRVSFMQGRVLTFVRDVGRSLAWYLWNDPFIEIPIVKRVPGFNVDIPSTFNEDAKEGDFVQYNIDIHPYSMQELTPSQRLQIMRQFNQDLMMFVQTGQVAGQAGAQANVEEFIKTYADYANLPEIEHWFNFLLAPSTPQDAPVQPPRGSNPATTRRYERINRSGGTRQNQDQNMVSTLMGATLQQSQSGNMLNGPS